MGDIKFVVQHCGMYVLVVFHTKIGINICEWRSSMLPFTKINRPAFTSGSMASQPS